jgi:twitching motility protein PilJ
MVKSKRSSNSGSSKTTETKKNEKTPLPPPQEKQGLTLRGRLLLGVVPTVLTPLIVAGVAGWSAIHTNIKNQYENRLQEQSLLASQVSNETLSNLLQVTQQIRRSPLIIEQTKEISNQVEAQELLSQPISRLEARYTENKVLDLNPTLNQYLQELGTPERLGEVDKIGEILVTEKHGFNVAYNQTPSDLSQKDEPWWEQGKRVGEWVGDFQVNEETTQTEVILVKSIRDPETGDFLGVIKMSVLSSAFDVIEGYLENRTLLETTKVQVLDTSANQAFTTLTPEGAVTEENTQGGEAVEKIARSLIQALQQESTRSAPEQVAEQYDLANQFNLEQTNLEYYNQDGRQGLIFTFLYQGRKYYLTTVPQTEWVAISSVQNQVLQAAGNELIDVFVLVGAVLGAVAVGIVVILARQLSSPLINVSQAAQKVAEGNLTVRVQLQGGVETRTLATSFNNLVERVQALLKEQEDTVNTTRRQREKLEEEVSQLMNDLEEAAEGDLTVRSRFLEGDVGIVADLFNTVVENLQDTAQQVKQAATRVSYALGENEVEIRNVAEGAIAQAEEIQATLNSVEEMTRSIEEVADNAQKAANIADNAFLMAQEGNEAMEETVESIQQLRSTVGETAQKMQEMGKSSEQITEVVSMIDQISLKTTLLAMNASLEAQQAGEFGKGFTAVAQQIESLSEQSASAAQKIGQIVNQIQVQTSKSIEAMELGNREVLASAKSVEKTKERLSDVVERFEAINQIMKSISHSTVSQAETSQSVSQLMEQVARSSQNRSQTSKQVAQTIQETVQVAKTLEASVEKFKVEK